MCNINFTGEKGRFTCDNPELTGGLYFPIASEKGIKSVVTPDFSGDSKLGQNQFIIEPTSIDDLHKSKINRNFWCILEDGSYWSATGNSAEAEATRFSEKRDQVTLEAGFMWQKVSRASQKYGLKADVISFVPHDENVEIMHVELTNTGSKTRQIAAIAAIPIFGRSADNLRDHRHVTSLLHRIRTTEESVLVRPTLSFDERGHQKNEYTYFVSGTSSEGIKPDSFYPTIDSFIGTAGTLLNPQAVAQNGQGVQKGTCVEGKEALGGIRFMIAVLEPGQSVSYTVLIGATRRESYIDELVEKYRTTQGIKSALISTENYWNDQVNISVHTGDDKFDNYMRWVTFQPFLRKIYGCSFLPHHDYGRGGRGWRDLWQDCLALLIMNPGDVGNMILNNYAGVRVDGTNATIIGEGLGEFIADRNGISRVWMDHGMWPFVTTKLYIDQTGDIDILTKPVAYFRDAQLKRGMAFDGKEKLDENLLKTSAGETYYGSVLEHILVENICAICETGEHGIIRLRGADWNDALDMAEANGESVAFSCAYAGNLIDIASYIKGLPEKEIELMEELVDFINSLSENKSTKEAAFNKYLENTQFDVSGIKKGISRKTLVEVLETLAHKMMELIRTQEIVGDNKGNTWFNSYYDNSKRQVEGLINNNVRMMLTGQVFAVMSSTATDEQVENIIKSADTYLFDKAIGGYRLNTNFFEEKYDMGRAFGFSYGDKENGAVFSHMAVMYAYALYKRGYYSQGYKALKTLINAAMNFETSKIYPGLPEYFNNDGQGLYHYLTGAASWYALSMVTQVFGVFGSEKRMVLEPKLVEEQLDDNKEASISLTFAQKKFEIIYDYKLCDNIKDAKVKTCLLDGEASGKICGKRTTIDFEIIESLDNTRHVITVIFE